ncbi:MAG: SDR family NAD(P)-dependent oxidoreductase [Sandaracinaceae bacterium]
MRGTRALEGATAVVTGAGSGLGRAFSVELGKLGGRVLAADIDGASAHETVALIEREGGQGRALEVDVRSSEQVTAMAGEARELFGDTDLLVNNAGIGAGGPFDEVTLEDWKQTVDVNLWGVVYGCHAFVPAMKARGRGFVINVASSAGLLSLPDMSPYNVTKAGVVALSETLHAELRTHGVHVSVLCPTFFTTRIMESARGPVDRDTRAAVQKLMARSKIQAPDVARAALAAVVDNDPYCIPMRDGRMLWRLKRALPSRFYDVLARMDQRRMFQRFAR